MSGAHVIVFGNEKGGTGKTTAAMHVSVALASQGSRVGVVDLDLRQASLSRQLENRLAWKERGKGDLPMPQALPLALDGEGPPDDAASQSERSFTELLERAAGAFDYLIIDTPGADTIPSRRAHAAADTLVTPLNDSFVDFDLLARVDPETFEVQRPSVYSNLVWECRKQRLLSGRPALDWLVMRNRLATTDARNKRRLSSALDSLAKRIGFRLAPGFGERVIYRELFPAGLTMLDLPQSGLGIPLSMSHLAARQEVRALMAALMLPQPITRSAAE